MIQLTQGFTYVLVKMAGQIRVWSRPPGPSWAFWYEARGPSGFTMGPGLPSKQIVAEKVSDTGFLELFLFLAVLEEVDK
jgi:hypothetical protein